jgi:hypothetical protein
MGMKVWVGAVLMDGAVVGFAGVAGGMLWALAGRLATRAEVQSRRAVASRRMRRLYDWLICFGP